MRYWGNYYSVGEVLPKLPFHTCDFCFPYGTPASNAGVTSMSQHTGCLGCLHGTATENFFTLSKLCGQSLFSYLTEGKSSQALQNATTLLLSRPLHTVLQWRGYSFLNETAFQHQGQCTTVEGYLPQILLYLIVACAKL